MPSAWWIGRRNCGFSSAERAQMSPERPEPGGRRAGSGSRCYLSIEYTRSPSSRLADATVRPILVPSVPLMNPRTLWACQPVAFINSARLAPLVRLIRSRTFAPLLSARRVPASLVRGALGAFLDLVL